MHAETLDCAHMKAIICIARISNVHEKREIILLAFLIASAKVKKCSGMKMITHVRIKSKCSKTQ